MWGNVERVGQRMGIWQERTEELAVELVKERYLVESNLIRAMLACPAVGLEAARGCGIAVGSFGWPDMRVFFEAAQKAEPKTRCEMMFQAALGFEKRRNWLYQKPDGYASSKWTPQRVIEFSRKYLWWLDKEREQGIADWVKCWARRLHRNRERMEAAHLLFARLKVVLKGEKSTRPELLAAEGKEVGLEELTQWVSRRLIREMSHVDVASVVDGEEGKGVPHSGQRSLLARRS